MSYLDKARALKLTMDADRAKATDLDVLVTEIAKLPPGQLKKVLTEPVLAVLKKYGYEVG